MSRDTEILVFALFGTLCFGAAITLTIAYETSNDSVPLAIGALLLWGSTLTVTFIAVIYVLRPLKKWLQKHRRIASSLEAQDICYFCQEPMDGGESVIAPCLSNGHRVHRNCQNEANGHPNYNFLCGACRGPLVVPLAVERLCDWNVAYNKWSREQMNTRHMTSRI